ncbi:hypothetical protein ACK8P5_25825 (plasmid) [Paenibacillus sp. EC2-1]|uniref:hypothetical protein n=1 Tax=Paenibacillus sp. EC2-1 TaxID=3388665 RepID=UPI003BEEE3C1
MGVMGQLLRSNMDAATQGLFSDQVRQGVKTGVHSLGRGTPGREAVRQSRRDLDMALKDLSPAERKARLAPGANTAEVQALRDAEAMRAGEITDGIKSLGTAAKDWALGRDVADGRAMTLAKRYGAVAAGSVGLGTAGRFLTGGDMTHDNRGNRDIAGIPFI